jgi:hypothetical protein
MQIYYKYRDIPIEVTRVTRVPGVLRVLTVEELTQRAFRLASLN